MIVPFRRARNATKLGTLLSLVCLSALCFGQSVPTESNSARDIRIAYEEHRWFDLRDAVKSTQVSPLYLGSIASAFNHPKDAEQYLDRAIKTAANPHDASQAHEALANLYARMGQNRKAVAEMDAILKIEPNRPDVQNLRPLFAAWSKYPDQSVARYERSVIQAEVSKDGIVLPVSIHGKTVHWGLDTDFSFSLISESEARMLGVPIDDTSAQAGDKSGVTTRLKTAVIDRLRIGSVELKNVSFLVEPDSQPPMYGLQPGQKGLLGFPVALALKAIAWKLNGTFEIGFPEGQGTIAQSNLCIDSFDPVTRVIFDGKPLDFLFDTGNVSGTQLWRRFGEEFPSRMKQGVKGTRQFSGVAGLHQSDVIVLPSIELRVGGLETSIKDVPVVPEPIGDSFHYGLLGLDLITQANEVRLDFRSMRLQLLPAT